jgi:hypothetical protein
LSPFPIAVTWAHNLTYVFYGNNRYDEYLIVKHSLVALLHIALMGENQGIYEAGTELVSSGIW